MEREQDINDYLHDRLSVKKRERFEKEMAQNPILRTQVSDIELIILGVKESERQELKVRLNTIQNSVKGTNKNKDVKKLKPYYFLAVAASVIGILMIVNRGFFNANKTNDEIYGDYFMPYPNTMQPVIRGEDSIDVTTKAFVAYESGNYYEASNLFEEILDNENKNHSDLNFYQAMSFLNDGKYENAQNILNRLKTDNNSSYTSEVYWYSALLESKKGNRKKAIELLDSLLSLNSDFNTNEAIRFSEDLKN